MSDFLDIILEAKGKTKAKAKTAAKPKTGQKPATTASPAPTDYGADAPADDDVGPDDINSGGDDGGDAGADDQPTDYSAEEVDVDPAQTGDDTGGDDPAATDDGTGDEATDYSDDGGDGTEGGDATDDGTGDGGDEATDYSDDGTGGDGTDGAEPTGDGTEADAGEQPADPTENVQNHTLLNDFVNLYYAAKNTVVKLSGVSKDNILVNRIISQVTTNLMTLKNLLFEYIVYSFSSSKYVANLYKYDFFIQAFKINLEMLKKISVFVPN